MTDTLAVIPAGEIVRAQFWRAGTHIAQQDKLGPGSSKTLTCVFFDRDDKGGLAA